MPVEVALWSPAWYGFDQTIEVDVVESHDLFNALPDKTPAGYSLVLYNGDYHERSRHLLYSRMIRILSISHPVLGAIKRVYNDSLSYEIERWNGKFVQVDAEQEPGMVEFGHNGLIENWDMTVEFETT